MTVQSTSAPTGEYLTEPSTLAEKLKALAAHIVAEHASALQSGTADAFALPLCCNQNARDTYFQHGDFFAALHTVSRENGLGVSIVWDSCQVKSLAHRRVPLATPEGLQETDRVYLPFVSLSRMSPVLLPPPPPSGLQPRPENRRLITSGIALRPPAAAGAAGSGK